jgi:hypothetical protein
MEAALAQTAKPLPGVRFGLVDAFAALQSLGRPVPRLEPSIEGPADAGSSLTAYSGIWTGAGFEVTSRWDVACATASAPPIADTVFASS